MTTAILGSTKRNSTLWVRQYPLAVFFLLVFGLTWSFMIVDVLGSRGIIPFRLPLPLMLVEGYMPTLAAVIVTGLTAGKVGLRNLFGKLLIVRVGVIWYGVAIFGLAAVCIASVLLGNQFGASPDLPILSSDMPPFRGLLDAVFNITVVFLIAGVINGEELAWRGFALPRLQARHSAFTSSLILSVPWILFHVPLFFTLGSTQEHMSFTSWAVGVAATTVLFTWVYNNTRGSVLLAYLLHAGMNTWTQVFSIDAANHVQGWMLTGVLVVTAVLVVAVYGAENLSRSHRRIQS